MSIVLEDLVKVYGGHPVVNHVSVEVTDGEFFVLLGPSGSGKSTVLRMIAGLSEIDHGRVLLHGRDVTLLPPQRRGVGMVFQHYALFRQMSVSQNIEFALRIRRVRSAKRRRRRDELLELVGLTGLGNRMPAQLSGGQQQRVALARALAHRPEVLLLDEPFGALDAKIRSELRRTIRSIQRELKVATIFVTHDQEEAFELADRIGIMNFGRLLEIGPPDELYLRPQTEFVATFLGTANLMVGEGTSEGVRLGPLNFPIGTLTPGNGQVRRIQVLFRPEEVAVKDSPEALFHPLLGEAVVEESSFAGSIERLRLRLPPMPGVRPISPPAPYGGHFVLIEASRSQHQARRWPLREGDTVWVGVRRVHALTHPGLNLLISTDGTAGSKGALAVGAQIARLAHARVTILAHGAEEAAAAEQLQRARERLGSGMASIDFRSSPDSHGEAVAAEADRHPYDLLVIEPPASERVETAELLLQAGEHHLMLVPPSAADRPIPSRVLICVAVGEPGKEDVLFAGRLARHLGAEAEILTVVRGESGKPETRAAQRFLDAGARTLSLIGVPARSAIRSGDVLAEIEAEIKSWDPGLLVLGTPLPPRRGRPSLEGLLARLLDRTDNRPVLIVRSFQGRLRG